MVMLPVFTYGVAHFTCLFKDEHSKPSANKRTGFFVLLLMFSHTTVLEFSKGKEWGPIEIERGI